MIGRGEAEDSKNLVGLMRGISKIRKNTALKKEQSATCFYY
jgi:hypothetical protein